MRVWMVQAWTRNGMSLWDICVAKAHTGAKRNKKRDMYVWSSVNTRNDADGVRTIHGQVQEMVRESSFWVD